MVKQVSSRVRGAKTRAQGKASSIREGILLPNALAECDRRIAHLQDYIAKLETRIADQTSMIVERDVRIDELNKALQDVQREHEVRGRQIGELRNRLEFALKNADFLHERNTIADVEHQNFRKGVRFVLRNLSIGRG